MRWLKHYSDETETVFIIELVEMHGLKGFYFWNKLEEVLARFFNFWAPGCYKFKTEIFYAFFYPHIKDKRTIRKILDYAHDSKKMYSLITGRTIYIYYPSIVKKADRYTTKRLIDANKNNQERPEDASILASICTNFVMERSKMIKKYVEEYVANK